MLALSPAFNCTSLALLSMGLLVLQGVCLHSADRCDSAERPCSAQCYPSFDRLSDRFAMHCLHRSELDTNLYRCKVALHAGTALSLTLRYSRVRPGPQFLASVAVSVGLPERIGHETSLNRREVMHLEEIMALAQVIYTEAIKLLICMAAQMVLCRRTSKEHTQGWRQVRITKSQQAHASRNATSLGGAEGAGMAKTGLSLKA